MAAMQETPFRKDLAIKGGLLTLACSDLWSRLTWRKERIIHCEEFTGSSTPIKKIERRSYLPEPAPLSNQFLVWLARCSIPRVQ